MVALPRTDSLTVTNIYTAYEAEASHGFRPHLGASLIGKECERSLWFDFRWTTRCRFTGRMLRLFETGQLEEIRLIRNLRRMGVTVLDIDPQTGRQWRVTACNGHFGGSLDAAAMGVPEAPKSWHVCEFKTHNTASFAALRKDGVYKAKPQHVAQMQIYMHLTGMSRALYLAVNKDTDELYSERLHADGDEADKLLAKAERIIGSTQPLTRISDDPTWYQCRMCSHHPVCHEGVQAERNCRTCLYTTPIENGHWQCSANSVVLAVATQLTGCVKHLFIPDLISGEQIDADPDAGWVEYRLSDGSLWRDGSDKTIENSR
ncbi:MAG: oxidoreductase [Magnetococcales bacterium]|nr:oxidoreductase [Magnetococcales bacterium]